MEEHRPTSSSHPDDQSAGSNEWRLLGTPFLTFAILMVCGGIWALLNFAAPEGGERVLFDRLAPSSWQIWRGAYWGLLTCAFVHLDALHCLFNMWWTRDF